MKLIKIIIFLFISFNTPLVAKSNDDFQNLLSKGGKLIFIRHAYAPGIGDPDNFDLSDCASQRNLSQKGIDQAKTINKFFFKDQIDSSLVLYFLNAYLAICLHLHHSLDRTKLLFI